MPFDLVVAGEAVYCGSYVQLSGEDLQSLISCVGSALSGDQTSTSIITSFTDEGDPIVQVWATRPSGMIDVYTDSSQDSFGGVGVPPWQQFECEASALPLPVPAAGLELSANAYFEC